MGRTHRDPTLLLSQSGCSYETRRGGGGTVGQRARVDAHAQAEMLFRECNSEVASGRESERQPSTCLEVLGKNEDTV